MFSLYNIFNQRFYFPSPSSESYESSSTNLRNCVKFITATPANGKEFFFISNLSRFQYVFFKLLSKIANDRLRLDELIVLLPNFSSDEFSHCLKMIAGTTSSSYNLENTLCKKPMRQGKLNESRKIGFYLKFIFNSQIYLPDGCSNELLSN